MAIGAQSEGDWMKIGLRMVQEWNRHAEDKERLIVLS